MLVVVPAYDDLDEATQVEELHEVARVAAGRFGLSVDDLRLVEHGFNTTFRVESAQGRYALRVNTNSVASDAMIRAQQEWQRAIAAETDVLVPTPRVAADGDWFVVCERAGRAFRVVVNGWLEGDDVGECTMEVARALGRAMAQLHEQAERWQVPPGGELSQFDRPLFGDRDVLRTAVAGADAEVLSEALLRSQQAFDALTVPRFAVHADLHGGNLKWHEGRLAVFDFDDCGIAHPLVDLAVATFYLRRGRDDSLEQALRDGYREVRRLPEGPPGALEALLADRQLLLANSLFSSTTPSLRAMRTEYLVATLVRLRHWLAAGKFRLDVPSDRTR